MMQAPVSSTATTAALDMLRQVGQGQTESLRERGRTHGEFADPPWEEQGCRKLVIRLPESLGLPDSGAVVFLPCLKGKRLGALPEPKSTGRWFNGVLEHHDSGSVCADG
jgi:hypothetical protein